MVDSFRTAGNDANWYMETVEPAGEHAFWHVATSGYNFVAKLQTALLGELTDVGREIATLDGATIGPVSFGHVDKRWGPATQKALYALTRDRGGSATLLAGIEADYRARTITPLSLRAAILFVDNRAVALNFPPGTVFPQWGVAAPATAPDAFNYTLHTQVDAFRTPAPNPPPPTDSGTGLPPTVIDPTPAPAPPVPLEPIPTVVPGVRPLPGLRVPTGSEVPALRGAGVPWALIAFAVGGVAAVGLVAWSVIRNSGSGGGGRRRTTRARSRGRKARR